MSLFYLPLRSSLVFPVFLSRVFFPGFTADRVFLPLRRLTHASFGSVRLHHQPSGGRSQESGDSTRETQLDLPIYLFISLIILSVFSSSQTFLRSTISRGLFLPRPGACELWQRRSRRIKRRSQESGDSTRETRLDFPLYLFISLIILSLFSSSRTFLGFTINRGLFLPQPSACELW